MPPINFQEAGRIAAQRAKETGMPLTGRETAEDIYRLAGVDRTGTVLPDKPPVSGELPGDTVGLLNEFGIDTTGFATSFNVEDRIKEQQRLEAERRETIETGRVAERGLISREYEEQVRQARQMMEKELGGVTAMGRRAAGLGATTTLEANLATTRQTGQQRIDRLTRQREDALARADMASAARLDASLAREQQTINTLYKDAWQRNIDIFNIQNQETKTAMQQTTMDWNIMSKLPAGQSWTSPTTGVSYTGINKEAIEPFFTGANIVSLMKTIPIGQSQQITDPNTGEVWQISGLGQSDVNTKVFRWVDPNNNQIIALFDQEKGEVTKQISAGKVRPSATQITIGAKTIEEAQLAVEEDAVEDKLIENMGEDLYTDPRMYLEERSNYSGTPAEFDALFAPFLSPQERARLGVGKAVGVKAIPEEEMTIEDLLFE